MRLEVRTVKQFLPVSRFCDLVSIDQIGTNFHVRFWIKTFVLMLNRARHVMVAEEVFESMEEAEERVARFEVEIKEAFEEATFAAVPASEC